jgi:hypothetical protein
MRPITGRRRPRERSKAFMRRVLDMTPEQQARAERGDPFPDQPGWDDETLADLHDNDRRTYDRRTQAYPVRRPTFTPAGPQQLPAPGSYPYQPPRNTQPLRRESGPQPAITRPYANRLQPPPVNLLPDVPRHRPLPPRALLPVRDRRAAVAQAWLDRLNPPRYDGYGHAEHYAAYMRSVGLITRTHTPLEHAGAWPQPTTNAGAPVPVSRGLAITAGEHLPRHAAAAIPVRRQPGRAGPLPPADLDLLARVAASLETRSA